MARGRWAQGIEPRSLTWVIQGKLAICERPGGYGVNHRKVRRQEEIIWIRENGFSFVVSLIPSPHNLHSYDSQRMPWKHWPFAPMVDLNVALPKFYSELKRLLEDGQTVLLHLEDVGDRLLGFVAGYLRWSGMVPDDMQAIMVVEKIMARQLGPDGRKIVTAAGAASAVNQTEDAQPGIRQGSSALIGERIDGDQLIDLTDSISQTKTSNQSPADIG